MSVARLQNLGWSIETRGRDLLLLSPRVQQQIDAAGLVDGVCHVFIRHTSASLLITENADPEVHIDLETVMAGLAPDGDARYLHRYEGDDDMAAHVRSVLTQTTLTVPVMQGRLLLGTWQGIYLWEHRYQPHRRELVSSLHGEFKGA